MLALGLLLTGGVALAGFVECTGGQCLGTEASDSMFGLDAASPRDVIFGLGARDEIATNRGDDFANGGPGDDAVHGQLGNDDLRGGSGRDFITGGRGNDFMGGGIGNDSIVATESAIFGPPEADEVDCGEDANGLDVDTAFVDRIDTVRNCEKVSFPR